ncbi:MAG: RNA-binding S4 domain-containing protein [Phenylobacterium sp.]|nr:MAG: RNA-binding S4 domain-containing protein [Phenylobacterium sp.]
MEGRPNEVAACRADVWLWRARFFKTRSMAAKFVEEGRVRLTRAGQEEHRLDKPARPIKVGDRLVFALGGRLVAVTVEAMGDRRGPADEARSLYSPLAGT